MTTATYRDDGCKHHPSCAACPEAECLLTLNSASAWFAHYATKQIAFVTEIDQQFAHLTRTERAVQAGMGRRTYQRWVKRAGLPRDLARAEKLALVRQVSEDYPLCTRERQAQIAGMSKRTLSFWLKALKDAAKDGGVPSRP